MKKTLWMLGMAVAALTSCTQSEVVDLPESKVIGFETFVNKQTRATDDILDSSEGGFKEFYVYGSYGEGGTKDGDTWIDFTNEKQCLNGVKVTGGKGNWGYQNHASWIAERTFRFAAYANGKGDGTGEAAKLENVAFVSNEEDRENDAVVGYVWGLDITGYEENGKDLIVAVPEQKVVDDITTAPPSVGLTFKHILAKVIIQFRTTNTNNNLHMQISGGGDDDDDGDGVSFTAYSKGDCEVRYTGVTNNTVIGAKWTGQVNEKDYTFFEGAEDWNSGNIQQEFYVIPQSNSGKSISKIVIDTMNDQDEVTASVIYENVSLEIASHTDWLPGYVYRYVADITPGQHYIHFTTSVNSWVDDDNRNHGLGEGTQTSGTGD